MLKQIGEWFHTVRKYSRITIKGTHERLAIVFNESGRGINFGFFVYNDLMLSYARVPNPSRWAFYLYFFGRRLFLTARKPATASQ